MYCWYHCCCCWEMSRRQHQQPRQPPPGKFCRRGAWPLCTQCCFSCTNRAWRFGHHNEVYLAMDSAGFEEGAELERIGLTRVHISSFHVNSNDPRLFGDRTVEGCHTRGVRRSFSPQRVHLEWRRKIRTDNEIIWLRLHHERGMRGGNGRCTAASRGGTTSGVVGNHISSGTGRNVAAGEQRMRRT